MSKKEKAVEVLNKYGFEATLNDRDNIDLWYDVEDDIRIFYSVHKDKLSLSVRSMNLGAEGALDKSITFDNAVFALTEIKEFAPELVE